MVHQAWFLGKFSLVVQTIDLSRLSVGPVGLLLDFIRSLSVG
jgi:hypothetical protein